MNLLAKIKNCGVLLLSLAIFNSCEEKGAFGIATDDVAPVEFLTTDVPLEASVVLVDSIVTSGGTIALFGQLNNSPFGNPVTATAYMGISANTGSQPEMHVDAALDSVEISFGIRYLFDTATASRALDLELYPITEEFYDTTYISSNSLMIGNELLASGQFQIDDFDSTYILDVDITANWINEFFQGVKSEDENFTNQTNFKAYFPGIAFKTSTTNENFFGIQTNSNFEINFYYNEPNDDNTDVVSKSFKMTATAMPRFHNVTVDRSSSQFAPIMDSNIAYDNTSLLGVHAGAGLVTKFDFSALEDFVTSYPDVIVNLAELTIGPIDDFPEGEIPPTSLIFYLTDNRNTRIPDRTTFRALQEDGVNPLASNNPVRFFYNPETKSYVGSISSYVKAFQGGTLTRSEFLAFGTEMSSSMKGFTFTRDKVNLKIFFSEVN